MVIPRNKFTLPSAEMNLVAQMPNIQYDALRKMCSMKETAIARKYGLQYIHTPDGGFYFKDNGADVLGVAHLDSVMPYMHFTIAKMRPDTWIFAPNLDDRLGAYVIADYLPKAGVECDILFTTNEEKGRSTARYFTEEYLPLLKKKSYHWMFMFDRSGTGATVYDYNNKEWEKALKDTGVDLGRGTYSCIKNLEHLECCGVNFGVGYHDYHTAYAFASKAQLMQQLNQFIGFYELNSHNHFSHRYTPPAAYGYSNHKGYKPVNNLRLLKSKEVNKGSEDNKEFWKEVKEANAKMYEATLDYLLKSPEEMDLPKDTLSKIVDLRFSNIAEIVSMSAVEFLNIPGINKVDAIRVRTEIGKYGLSFSTDITKEYGITIVDLEEDQKREEPQKEKKGKLSYLVPVTRDKAKENQEDETTDTQSEAKSETEKPHGILMWTVPLTMSKIKTFQRKNEKGDFEWVNPTQEVGFKTPERKAA